MKKGFMPDSVIHDESIESSAHLEMSDELKRAIQELIARMREGCKNDRRVG